MLLQAVELSAQVQKCHQVVDATAALSLSSPEQRSLLASKRKLLQEKRWVREGGVSSSG